MSSARRALVSWSSGKDSAWVLHELRSLGEVEVMGLLTTVSERFDRVAMHGVRRELLRLQAEAAGLPLWIVELPTPCSNEQYEAKMSEVLDRARAAGVDAVAFGDLFLADVRRYREERLRPTGIEPLFPLWGRPTRALVAEMLASGLRARIACIDPRCLPRSFAGAELDAETIARLPEGVDPCGENGEFHTFAWSGPMFAHAVPIRSGEIVERDGSVFADLLPA